MFIIPHNPCFKCWRLRATYWPFFSILKAPSGVKLNMEGLSCKLHNRYGRGGLMSGVNWEHFGLCKFHGNLRCSVDIYPLERRDVLSQFQDNVRVRLWHSFGTQVEIPDQWYCWKKGQVIKTFELILRSCFNTSYKALRRKRKIKKGKNHGDNAGIWAVFFIVYDP